MLDNVKRVTLIGSRKAPSYILNDAFQIGKKLAERGIEMYSGGADGMDDAFERGYISAGRMDLMNIILPKAGFNKKSGESYYPIESSYPLELISKSIELMRMVHPYGSNLTGFPLRAHCRNCFQVLGHDLKSPTDAVILWAPINGASVTGGTRTAFNLARQYKTPTYNLASPDVHGLILSSLGIMQPSLSILE